MDSPADHAINVAITTHTTRHFRRTILGVSALKPAAARVVIACDNDRADVRDLVLASSAEFAAGLPQGLIYVSRPSVGECALSQNRNNAIRTLIACGARDSESVAFLDGDCIPASDLLAVHASALRNPASRRDLVCAYRVDLSAEQTECIDESAVLRGHPAARITAEQSALLADRQRRHARAARLRGLGLGVLVKGHKPKILGANFAVTLRAYLAVNGFDEEYLGYGSEDDDFARRIYAAGFRPAVRVDSAIVCHQWHETRKPANWHDSPGVKRFELSLPTRCIRGVENPMPQQTPVMEVFINGQAKPVAPGAIS